MAAAAALVGTLCSGCASIEFGIEWAPSVRGRVTTTSGTVNVEELGIGDNLVRVYAATRLGEDGPWRWGGVYSALVGRDLSVSWADGPMPGTECSYWKAFNDNIAAVAEATVLRGYWVSLDTGTDEEIISTFSFLLIGGILKAGFGPAELHVGGEVGLPGDRASQAEVGLRVWLSKEWFASASLWSLDLAAEDEAVRLSWFALGIHYMWFLY